MPEGKKPLITRERYRAYLQEKGKESRGALKGSSLKLKRSRGKAEPEEDTDREKQPVSRQAKKQNGKEAEPRGKKSPKEKRVGSVAQSRLSEKERGRRLDKFYNWAILIVLVAIILVFVLAFVI